MNFSEASATGQAAYGVRCQAAVLHMALILNFC